MDIQVIEKDSTPFSRKYRCYINGRCLTTIAYLDCWDECNLLPASWPLHIANQFWKEIETLGYTDS